jgi:hypothetical protein
MWRRAGCCSGNGGDEITEVDIYGDGMPVGIVALKQAFEQLYAVGLRSKDPVGDQLLAMIKARNYVPRSAEERYKAVLSREYAAFCSEMEADTKR